MSVNIADSMAVSTELPAQLKNSKPTRYGLANIELENAISADYPEFRHMNSAARESILEALFVMRGPAIEALNAGGKEIDKIGGAA